MDAVVAAAIEEVALEGLSGCPLPKLWGLLQGVAVNSEFPLDGDGKQLVWQALVNVPGLVLLGWKLGEEECAQPDPVPASDASFQNVEEVERLGLLLVAPATLRDACLGVYDLKQSDSHISDIQRGVLERLAKARYEGVTQNVLAKDFHKDNNAMFYVLKSLETRGLLVRQSTIVRNKEVEPSRHGSIVATNLVHLTRFAKNLTLASHQRFEILKPSSSHEPATDGRFELLAGKNSIIPQTCIVNDDFPAMKIVCEKLEAAAEKVLVISDVKLSLGYRLAAGHRTWRRLVKRLQDAGLVQTFNAQIDGKIVACLKLLKSFDAKSFHVSNEEVDCDSVRAGKRGQVTEQLAELPIDHQLYELIKNSGFEGLHMAEALKRLGLRNKRNYYRVTTMLAKQVVVTEAETVRKTTLYRLRTPEYASASTDPTSEGASTSLPLAGGRAEKPPASSQEGASEEPVVLEKHDSQQKDDTPPGLQAEGAICVLTSSDVHLQDGSPDQQRPAKRRRLVKAMDEGSANKNIVVTSRTNAQREQRILKRLKAEGYLLRVELHRWLEDIEDRNGTVMDRKTLGRLLHRLESRGACKSMKLSMPGLTNCGRKRESEVIISPDIEVTSDLVKQFHLSVRKFDAESRGQGICRTKNLTGVPVLTGVVTRMNQQKKPPFIGVDPLQGRSLKDNGFIPAKMVRVRMLHYYLWTYVNSCTETKGDLVLEKEEANADSPAKCNLPDKCNTFVLSAAVAAMPLELYLQIIGSTQNVERLPERCKQGVRMSDISTEELNALVERTSGARLSWLVDILCRLQLVQLKMGRGQISCKHGPLGTTSTSLSYALELKPWIEEPATQALPSFSSDVFSMERHNFVLSKKEDLDAYWQTLEYVCSGADPKTGRRAFPGSKVPELFCVRSWTSIRIMSIEQRRELFKRIGAGGPETRKSADECAKIARDLNLTVEQVLRVSYEKNRKVRLQALAQAAAESGTLPEASFSEDGKVLPRNRAGIETAVSEPAHVRAFKRQRRLLLDASTVSAPAPAPAYQSECEQTPARNVEEGIQLSQEEEEDDDDVCGQEEVPGICVAYLRPSRSRRFPWSDRLDRILIACYSKQRAILGARHHRVDWGKIPGLPAKPTLCRRRMALLRTDATVRSAISTFCSLLSARYLESLEISRAGEGQRESQLVRRPITGSRSLGLVLSSEPATSPVEVADLVEDGSTQGSSCAASLVGTKGQFSTWDNLEDLPVLRGLEEVMRCKIEARAKRLSGAIGRGATKNKIGILQRESTHKHCLENPDVDAPHLQAPASFKSRCPSKIDNPVLNVRARPGTGTRAVRSRAKPRPVLKPLLSLPSTDEIVRSSLKVANCIELLKLILLNAGAMDRESLVDALKRYKHGDVLTAFSFLRYHELVDVAHDKKQFILSPKFHHSCSASQFPSGTGEESLSTETWLKEHGRALQSEWVTLSPEQTCGQLLHLFGLVAGGQFVLAPFLPDEGIGESEEYTNMVAGTKRKADSDGDHCSTKLRIPQHESQCLNLRRERGYPGIAVSIHRASSAQSHEMIACDVRNGTSHLVKHMDCQDLQVDSRSDKKISEEVCEPSGSHLVSGLPESIPIGAQSMDTSKSLLEKCIDRWCLDSSGAHQSGPSSLDPFMLKAIFHAIEQASDEGLSMDQLLLGIKQKGGCHDDNVTMEHAEVYVEALLSFKLVQKVNAFDDVRIVSAQHAEQYMLHFKAPTSCVQMEIDGSSLMPEAGNSEADTLQESNPHLPASPRNVLEGVSTVSAGAPDVVVNSCAGVGIGDTSNCNSKVNEDKVDETTRSFPIRPWLTSDGTLNTNFMKAMTRRVMGIIMLNPGITEDLLVENMGVLNPQNAREFLQTLESAGHLHVRSRLQAHSASPPHLLSTLIGLDVKKALEAKKTNRVKHYYPNPLDSKLL